MTTKQKALTKVYNGEFDQELYDLVDAMPAPKSLLTSGDAKTSKGEALGYRTGILYLSPASRSGRNVCPASSEGCRSACLNTAGRGAMANVQLARLRKTRYLYSNRKEFIALLHKDTGKLVKYAVKRNMTPVVRLNGTSDIPWHREAFGSIPQEWPLVQFYGYTKRKDIFRDQPANSHTTFSLAEDNLATTLQMLDEGINAAVVFDTLPDTWYGHRVVDGDKHDLTFKHGPDFLMGAPQGVVLGLKAKGKARKDTSGFVQLTRKATVAA